MRKMVIEVFPRARYAATTSGRTYTPRERAKLAKLMGEANEIWFHTRVYARDTGVSWDFDITHGCLGDQFPADGLRQFALTQSSTTPNLPYDGTNMATLPDDGVFYVQPRMGAVDTQGKAAGANGSIEVECWATLLFES